jgi:SnoaL-like domain
MATNKLSVEDRLDIHDLFAVYGFLVDEGKADEWSHLFTDDGVFDVPGLVRMEGRAQVAKIVDMVHTNSKGMWRHQLTNILALPGTQPGTATVRMNGLVTDWAAEKLSTFNDYSGRLRKINGEWKIVEILAKPTRITV